MLLFLPLPPLRMYLCQRSLSPSTSKYPWPGPFSSVCLLGVTMTRGLARPALRDLMAWKVACSLVWPALGLFGCDPGAPLQLVARLKLGACGEDLAERIGGGVDA